MTDRSHDVATGQPPRVGDVPLWECWQFLEQHSVARICVHADGYPLAFPVNYRCLGEAATNPGILIRTRPGNTIGRSLGLASVEIDEIDMAARRAISIIVRGQLRPVEGWTGLPDPHPWVTAGREAWLVLAVDSISGRRFEGVAATDANASNDNAFSVEWSLEK